MTYIIWGFASTKMTLTLCEGSYGLLEYSERETKQEDEVGVGARGADKRAWNLEDTPLQSIIS